MLASFTCMIASPAHLYMPHLFTHCLPTIICVMLMSIVFLFFFVLIASLYSDVVFCALLCDLTTFLYVSLVSSNTLGYIVHHLLLLMISNILCVTWKHADQAFVGGCVIVK